MPSDEVSPPSVAPPTKFHVPVHRQNSVSRRELVTRIVRSGQPLVTVTAPAGYGKTSLLTELAASDGRDVAWLSLDAADNDPVTLARGVAVALSQAGIVRESLIDQMWDGFNDPDRSAINALGTALAGPVDPFVLVIDDTHLLTSQQALGALDRLASQVPARSQLVLAGRSEPAFVARLRVAADVIELQHDDLVLDDRGAVDVFAAAGVAIAVDDARQVIERTEGWPAGVYLAALIARDGAQRPGVATSLEGSNRVVADYLLGHVFESLSEDVQGFLLDTAALEEMCAAQCEYVLSVPNAQQILNQLERDNLFVVPLDSDRTWYRYHALFRQFLLSEAKRHRPAIEPDDTRRRASAWCAANGRPDQAIEYLLHTRDPLTLGRLLLGHLRPTYMQGRVATVDRWLESAGTEVIEQLPPLAVLAGWTAALSGRPAEAERWASRSDGLVFEGVAEDGWASFASSSAALRGLLCADGVERMNRDAEFVVESEPLWSPWRNTALWLLGQARELAGDREGAIERYEEALRLDDDRTRTPILVTPIARALVAMDIGDWSGAELYLDRARRSAEVLRPASYLTAVMAEAAHARLALHRGDLARCNAHIEIAMSARALGTYAVPYAAVRLLVGLAELHIATGRPAVARQLMAEIDAILTVRPGLGSLLEDVALTRDRLATAPRGVEALSPAELRLLPYLSTHLTFAAIGAELYLSRHTVHSHAGSIYRKFGVSSRPEAVERARELGFGLR